MRKNNIKIIKNQIYFNDPNKISKDIRFCILYIINNIKYTKLNLLLV